MGVKIEFWLLVVDEALLQLAVGEISSWPGGGKWLRRIEEWWVEERCELFEGSRHIGAVANTLLRRQTSV